MKKRNDNSFIFQCHVRFHIREKVEILLISRHPHLLIRANKSNMNYEIPDPDKLTISQLKSLLTQYNLQDKLPSVQQPKKVYVDLFKEHVVPIMQERNTPLASRVTSRRPPAMPEASTPRGATNKEPPSTPEASTPRSATNKKPPSAPEASTPRSATNKKPPSTSSWWRFMGLLVLCSAVAVGVLVATSEQFRTEETPYFCDTTTQPYPGKEKQMEGIPCVDCPLFGICKDGRLVRCMKGYISSGGVRCARDQDIARAIEFCHQEAHKLLALRAGAYECGDVTVPAPSMDEQV